MAVDNFKPTLWEGALLHNFHSVSIADVMCTKPSNVNGKTVTFNRVAAGSLKDYSGTVDWAEIETTPVEMTFDKKKYFAFALDDVDKVQLKADVMTATTQEHSAVLAEQYDKDFFVALTTGVKLKIGAAGSKKKVTPANAYDYIVDLGTMLSESGCYRMYNKVTGTMSDVAVSMDESTGEIIGIYDATNNEVAGYTTDMAEATKKMADSEEGSYEQIISAQMRFDEESGNIVLANGEVVGSMEEVTKATDGTRTGIVKINGTPYNIKVNKDGTISALNAVNTAADNAARARKITFSVGVNIGSSVNSALQNVKAGLAGSYFNGLDNVPYDGFRAVLHKGERVLTAEENKSYSSGRDLTDYGAIKKIVRSELNNIVIELNDREMGRAYSRYAAERR